MVDSSFPLGKVVVHPNEGFDLGLMNTCYPVKVYLNIPLADFQQEKTEAMQGQIFLENTCRKAYAELSQKTWNKMGSPENVILIYENGKLLILSVPKSKS